MAINFEGIDPSLISVLEETQNTFQYKPPTNQPKIQFVSKYSLGPRPNRDRMGVYIMQEFPQQDYANLTLHLFYSKMILFSNIECLYFRVLP